MVTTSINKIMPELMELIRDHEVPAYKAREIQNKFDVINKRHIALQEQQIKDVRLLEDIGDLMNQHGINVLLRSQS